MESTLKKLKIGPGKNNMKTITINIGSRSKKYSYFEDDNLIFATETAVDNEESLDDFIAAKNINMPEIVIGIRIVAPGLDFREHKVVTKEYLVELKKTLKIAPLHTETTIKEIERINFTYPNTRIIAISDSAFHQTIPEPLKYYAIPELISKKYSILKQGYHGISLGSIISKLQANSNPLPENIIVAHLGGGSSVTAIKNGTSVDTSMGFTPLDGIPMAERIGSIDAGALLYIGREESLSYDELLHFISHSCGLEAVSGVDHGDLKTIIDHSLDPESKFYDSAKLAILMYTLSVAKQIASMSVALQKIDLLVFTGTVGELSAPIRKIVTSYLTHLGILIDDARNNSVTKSDQIQLISQERSTGCVVIFTDEAKEMQTILKQFTSL